MQITQETTNTLTLTDHELLIMRIGLAFYRASKSTAGGNYLLWAGELDELIAALNPPDSRHAFGVPTSAAGLKRIAERHQTGPTR
jgi:hypothetical protein